MSRTSRRRVSRALQSIALVGVALASIYACTSNTPSSPQQGIDGGDYDAGFSITNCPNGGVLASACATCITTSCTSQVATVNTACASALACACPLGVDAASCALPAGCVSAIASAALQCTSCESACGLTDASTHDAGGDATVVVADAAPLGDAALTSPDAFVTYDAGLPPSLVQAPHLQLWLRADDGVVSSGASEPYAVSVWQDLSGHARNATQPLAANQPLLHTTTPLTGTSSQLPWVQFVAGTGDGNGEDAGSSSQFMGVDLSFLASSSYTILAVASRNSDKSENYFLGTHFGGAGTDTALHLGWSDNTDFYLGQFGDDLPATVTAIQLNDWQPVLATAKLDMTAGKFIYLSGTLAASNTAMGALSIADQGILGRGYASTPDNTYYLGGVGEIIVYDSALSDTDRQSVEAYLQARWQP